MFLLVFPLVAQVSIVSWNIADFGKTRDATEIRIIASLVKEFDIIALQEVVAIDPGGAKAVARLADQLNRSGARWDYVVSDPTDSPGKRTERYAYLWKTNKAKLIGRAWLDKSCEPLIYREPFLARFRTRNDTLLLVNYHSRSYKDHPQEEIECFYHYPISFEGSSIIIAGDFNTKSQDKVFQPLYAQGFQPNLKSQKTTLKRKCGKGGAYLNHPIDYILYETTDFELLETGIVDFVKDCELLTEARWISDHLPVWLTIQKK